MATVEDIRDEYFGKGKTISEIAREQRMDRKTLRKFIEREDWNRSPEGGVQRSSILDRFKAVIDGWLEHDRRRRRKQRAMGS